MRPVGAAAAGGLTAEEHVETARAMAVRIHLTRRTDNLDEITRHLLAELGIEGDAAAVLWHWVREGVRLTLTSEFRRQNESRRMFYDYDTGAYRPYTGPVTLHKAGTTDGSTEFRTGPLAFLDAKVLVRGGFKKWRHLTADDHRERIRIHDRNASAAMATIRSHDWALAELDTHAAGTLGDISETILAAELPGFVIRT